MLNSHTALVANWTGHSRYITFPHCRRFLWRALPGSFWAFQAICDLPQWVTWNAKDVLELHWVVLRTFSAKRLPSIPHAVLSDKRPTVSQLRIRFKLWSQTPYLFGSCLSASQHTQKTHDRTSLFGLTHWIFHLLLIMPIMSASILEPPSYIVRVSWGGGVTLGNPWHSKLMVGLAVTGHRESHIS